MIYHNNISNVLNTLKAIEHNTVLINLDLSTRKSYFYSQL